MKKQFQSLFSKSKESKKKVSKWKVSATIFALLCSSMFVVSEKQIAAEEPNYQGESFETGAYQHDAPAPYGFNYSQNSSYASTNTNKINWIYSLPYEEADGKRDIKQFWGKPAIDKDGIVYMNNQNGYTYALNRDGTLKWKLKVEGDNTKTNVIGSDGTIYNASKKLNAINPDGTVKWVAEGTTPNYVNFSEPVIDKDGTIYVLNNAKDDTKLYAFNPDGSLKFKGTTDLTSFGTKIVHENGLLLGKNGYIYLTMTNSSQKFVVALDKNGNKVWSKEFYGTYLFHGMDSKGDLFVTNWYSARENRIYKLSGETGDILIEKKYSTITTGFIGAPIVDYTNGDIYLYIDNQLTKFDSNLNELWKKPYSLPMEVAIDKNGDIVFAETKGIYKLNAQGEEIWKLDYTKLSTLGLSVGKYNPAIDKEGKVYLHYDSMDKNNKSYYNLISIGDPVEQPIDFCTYYGSLEKKLNEKTLTTEEQSKAIQQTENLLNRLKSYSAE